MVFSLKTPMKIDDGGGGGDGGGGIGVGGGVVVVVGFVVVVGGGGGGCGALDNYAPKSHFVFTKSAVCSLMISVPFIGDLPWRCWYEWSLQEDSAISAWWESEINPFVLNFSEGT